MPPRPLPRSIYARKLQEFPGFTFADEGAVLNRGRWRDYFRPRVGPSYDGRIIVEIGCADAAFCATIAARYPASGFVGLDWKCKAIYDAARRVTDLGVANVALLRARGQEIAELFGEGEVDEIWIFHPDPCAQEHELKMRLVSAEFLVKAATILRTDAVLAIKTDHRGYYNSVLKLFVPGGEVCRRFEVTMASADFSNDSAVRAHVASRPFAGETTLFENRFMKKRLAIHYVELRKKQGSSDLSGTSLGS